MSNKIAFIFPGQGSQSVGMLSAYQDNPLVLDTFAEASAVIGLDLWEMSCRDPDNKLNMTAYTQPVILTASIALWRVWQDVTDITPDFCAGHSLGEYSALTAAGVLTFRDAVRLVSLRGQYMQQAVPNGMGAMAAIIGLDDAVVLEICQQVQTDAAPVSIANYNSKGQLVIGGHVDAVAQAMKLAKESGAKLVKQLDMSVPSHCILMKDAADKLSEEFAHLEWREPLIPVINNVDVACHQSVAEIQQALARQLYCPVRWVEIIERLCDQSVGHFVECGPGKVLSGLLRRINKSVNAYQLLDPNKFQDVASALERN